MAVDLCNIIISFDSYFALHVKLLNFNAFLGSFCKMYLCAFGWLYKYVSDVQWRRFLFMFASILS